MEHDAGDSRHSWRVNSLSNPVWWALLIAVLASWVVTPALRQGLLAWQVVDLPDARRSHHQVTPRGGGLAIFFGLMLGLLFAAFGLAWSPAQWLPGLLLAFSLVVLGAFDDWLQLSVRVRLVGQLLIAGAALSWLGGVEQLQFMGQLWHQPLLWSGLALIGFLWLINLHNFMDGSDGLASAQAIWSGLAYAVLLQMAGQPEAALLAALLAASALGFLWWNRPVARIFLGDAGSLMIGGLIAWLAVTSLVSGSLRLADCMIISALFVVDATATLCQRLMAGERWYTAHRSHAYQRLLSMGWSHGKVLTTYMAVNALVVLPALLMTRAWPDFDLVVAAGAGGLLLIAWWSVQSAANGALNRA